MPEPVRTLLLHWGRRGAGCRLTLALARALAARDDLAVHLSYARQAELASDLAACALPRFVVDTYEGPFSALASVARVPRVRAELAAYLRRHDVQVVFCTMTHLWTPAMVAAIRAAGARYLLAVHDATLHPGERVPGRAWWLGREIDAADAVVTFSAHVRTAVVARARHAPADVHVLPLGPLADATARGPRRHPTGRPFRLLFFGRLLPYKGLEVLREAFTILRASHPDLELVVAGEGGGDVVARLRATPGVRVAASWIAEHDVPALLADADLLVAPHLEASQSGSVATALGAGLPVVVTPIGGLPEQVRDGETGGVAIRADAAALAAAIDAFVRDPRLYARAARNAAALAEGGALDWRRLRDAYAAVIHREGAWASTG